MADVVVNITAIVGALTGLATLVVAVLVFITTRQTHDAVNSNHQQDIDRIDQLTQVITKAPDATLPPRPPHE
jgi:hypothetical protein